MIFDRAFTGAERRKALLKSSLIDDERSERAARSVGERVPTLPHILGCGGPKPPRAARVELPRPIMI